MYGWWVGGLPREGVLMGCFGVGGFVVGLGGPGAAYFDAGAVGEVLVLLKPWDGAERRVLGMGSFKMGYLLNLVKLGEPA